ncbi:uncharacterized protein SAPINGB_P001323 [Magnusiomyces paraingens]|uniref:Glutamine synthetase n=1 Tax=Magnusiomyces paraingens TaxID=2606893 RepID=A0A5E8B7A8_9ASCO|nr:uncharacterized protein SAPINGB_P001323 [Saprochaete ingens]VVT46659.1 unnamed protein product [Saprochaete ingens]
MSDLLSMDQKKVKDLVLSRLREDAYVKVAGVDVDGILRGKIISRAKFLSVVDAGFGFCSVIFGWDMHDKTYAHRSAISNEENGFRDMLAIIDLTSYRRIPWESTNGRLRGGSNEMPFFLVHFCDPETHAPIAPDPRSLLATMASRIADSSAFKDLNPIAPFAGMEFEFFQYRETHDTIYQKRGLGLTPLTPGMFGYSVARLGLNKEYQREMLDSCESLGVGLEGWHTETGPGVFETAIGYCDARRLADNATLFKFAAKTIGAQYGIMPCFMAKPQQGLPGNSGHIHVSLMESIQNEDKSITKRNLFTRTERDTNAAWPDIEYLSDIGRHFLAGVLAGLPWVMPLFAPTINSYKRLVENFWAPVTVSWGLEHRVASIRLICDPQSPKSTRFEVRTPGADVQPHLALAAIYALGLRGIEEKLELTIPPMGAGKIDPSQFERLPRSLRAATERFMAKDSLARVVLGDDFVDHYGATRLHECREWDDAVTNWEVERYIETI